MKEKKEWSQNLLVVFASAEKRVALRPFLDTFSLDDRRPKNTTFLVRLIVPVLLAG